MDSLLGIPVGVVSLDEAVGDALRAIDGEFPQIVFACANSHSLNVARFDSEFRSALTNADQLVADGVGVTAIARLARKDVGPRIIGHQYFDALMAGLSAKRRGRVFFFGSSEKVLTLIKRRFESEYPNLNFCGFISPPYGEWSDSQNREYVRKINEARPDILWVGMTAPKQEKWVYSNREQLSVPVIASVGAVFDFFAGTVKPSPAWARKAGIESIYRLAREPRRMWKRAIVSSVNFIWIGLWHEVLWKRGSHVVSISKSDTGLNDRNR
jgi:N-acetylglucosaminyldiphosphoundecaprenol N-acetyl-beta-D-mannosaminyltransferase